MSCVILGCKSHSSRNEKNVGIISFHRFPSDFNIRQKWIEAINRSNWKWKKLHRFCSRHFEDTCFINISYKWRRLKSYAVPTLHLCEVIDMAPAGYTDISADSESSSTVQSVQQEIDVSHYVSELEQEIDKLQKVARRRLLKINALRQQTKRLRKKNIDMCTRFQNFLKNENNEKDNLLIVDNSVGNDATGQRFIELSGTRVILGKI